MSTPDRPLTRRQLKEMRRTGQLPVVTPEDQAEDAAADAPAEETRQEESEPTSAAAETTADATDAPASDAEPEAAPAADSAPAGADQAAQEPAEPPRPLTRRELRMQRERTSQLNVVSPAEQEESSRTTGANRLPAGFEGTSGEVAPDEAPAEETPDEAPAEETSEAPTYAETAEVVLDDEVVTPQRASEEEPQTVEVVAVDEESAEEPAAESTGSADGRPKVGASFGAAVFQQAEERQRQEREEAEREAAARREAREREEAEHQAAEEAEPAQSETSAAPTAEPASSATTRDATAHDDEPSAGNDTGEVIAEAFQRSHDTSGSTAGNSSALILKDMPGVAALNAPITATGELILTSSHTLPEGFGSSGAAAGTTDGRDVDAELIDGELPMSSSPSPIAASSAVSTSKAPGEVIRPPAPEKNHKLMLTLGITAGVLGVALIGVVVYVFASGVFTN